MESLSQDGTQELLSTRWLSSLAGTEVIDVRLPTWAALWQELRKTASARVCVSSVVSDESESWQDIRVAKRFWTLSTRRGTIWCNENRDGENRKMEKEVGSYIWEGTEHWSQRCRSQRRKYLSKEFCATLWSWGKRQRKLRFRNLETP